ncbi:mitochondrial ribosomal protein L42 [Ptiloglossa arizonensis]|uniref:mitochondrial ribosomal protein L42 n=1 Tax=Ptiloglossa arizonensis TaxID=3350558 RepID=UPI003FA12346
MNIALYTARILNISCKRYLSSNKLPMQIVTSINNEMIICWHPKQEFPYEYSLPLPEEKQIESTSILCIGEKEIAETYKSKRREEMVQDLAKITYTTKHRWYPNNSERKIRRIEPDRPYL